jgi:hypothetical protein
MRVFSGLFFLLELGFGFGGLDGVFGCLPVFYWYMCLRCPTYSRFMLVSLTE